MDNCHRCGIATAEKTALTIKTPMHIVERFLCESCDMELREWFAGYRPSETRQQPVQSDFSDITPQIEYWRDRYFNQGPPTLGQMARDID